MVRFWDTSALIALVVAERATARAERWLREDPDVVVWTLTRVELLSALARRRRCGGGPRTLARGSRHGGAGGPRGRDGSSPGGRPRSSTPPCLLAARRARRRARARTRSGVPRGLGTRRA